MRLNIRKRVQPKSTTAKLEAVDFNNWLIDKMEKGDLEDLERYVEIAPHSHYAVPRPEHFVPLFNVMGSFDENKTSKVINRSYEMGTFGNLCFEF